MREKKDKELRSQYRYRSCLMCGKLPSEACHIKTFGNQLTDRAWNLLPFCRLCHIKQHNKGWLWVIDQYPNVWTHMKTMGWYYLDTPHEIPKLWNDKITEKY